MTRCKECTKYDPGNMTIGQNNVLTPCKSSVITQVDMDNFGCALWTDKHNPWPLSGLVKEIHSIRVYKQILFEHFSAAIHADNLTKDGLVLVSQLESIQRALVPIFETFDRATAEIE